MRFKLLAALAVGLVGIVALAGSFFLLTQPGLRILVRGAGFLTPGTLEVDQARGRLAGPMRLAGIRYVDGDLEVNVVELQWDIRLSSFLARRVDLDRLRVAGLTVHLPAPSEQEGPPGGPPDIRTPLTLTLEDGVVEDLTIIPDQGQPVAFQRIALNGSIGRKGLTVDSLAVTKDALEIKASGSIRTGTPEPINLRYAWSFKPEDLDPFRGEGEITGSWLALTASHRLTSPFTSDLVAIIRDPVEEPSAEVQLTFGELSPAGLIPGWPEGDLSGEAAGAGRPDSFSLAASLEGRVAGTMDLTGGLSLTREGPLWKLDSGRLESARTGMDLSVTGQLDTADPAAPLTLAASWRNVTWPMGAAEPLLTSREGDLSVKGRREAFTARLAAHLEGKGIGPGTGTLAGAGDEKGFTVESLGLPLLGGEVRGTGSVQWVEGLAWRLTARGSALDPGLLLADWPGRASLALEASGRQKEGDRSLLLNVTGIGGTLRGHDLDGSLKLEVDGPTLRVEGFDLSLGTTRLTAAGVVGDDWDLEASLVSGDVGVLASGAMGSAAASVILTGPRDTPRIRARLEGDRLAVGTVRARRLSAKADAAMDPEAPFTADIRVTGASLQEGTAGTLSLTGSGSWRKHRVALEAAFGEERAAAVIEGGADTAAWAGGVNASLMGGSVTGRGSVGLTEPRRWDAALKVEGIDPGKVRPDLAGELSFEAAGRGDGGPGARQWSVRIDELDGRTRGLPVRGEAFIEAAQDRVTLTTLDVRLGRSSLEASGGIAPEFGLDARILVLSLEEFMSQAAGQADLALSVSGPTSAPVIRLEGSASDLSVPSAGLAEASLTAVLGPGLEDPAIIDFKAREGLLGGRSIDTVSLSVDGTLSSHRGTLLVSSSLTEAEISLLGQMKGSSWSGSADGTLLGGTFRIAGGIDWKGPLRFDTRLEISDIEAQRVAASLPERVSLSGQASGEVTETGFAGQVRVPDLSGSYRGHPLMGQADLEGTPEGLTVRTLELGVGDGRLSLSGQALSRWDLDWALDLPDLSSLTADLGGAVSASGRVTGPREAPRVRGAARAGNVSYGPVRIEKVDLDAEVDPAGPSLIRFDLAGLTSGEYDIQSVSVTAAGPLSSHAVSLNLVSSLGDLEMRLAGGIRDGSWTGQVARWEIASKVFGDWSLTRGAPVSVDGVIQAGPACLANRDGEICMEGRWLRDDRLGDGTLRWTGLGLDLAEGVMPAGFDLKGTTEGSVKFGFSGGAAALTGRLETSPGSIAYARTGEKDQAEMAFLFARLGADVTLDEAGLRGRVDGDLGKEGGREGQFLLATFEVPGLRVPAGTQRDDLRVKGSLKARFADLDLMEALVPELSRVQGVFTADLTLGGPVRKPELEGRMSLTEGTFKLITPGITLARVDLKANVASGNVARIEGSAVSGKGNLKADGTMALDPERGWPVDLNLSGDSFEMARTPYIRILVSPDLKLGFERGQIRASGTVRVPEASIEPADIMIAAPPSSDVKVKGRQEVKIEEEPVKVTADVTLEMGEKISFKGFGLTGRISGTIGVTERPDAPTTATGELQVNNGEYRAFGKTLAIERGRLVFTGGEIDNPGLDIRAVRKVREVTAGVQVSGTILSPVLTLVSEPPLEESEILSYLVLGRPLAQASTEDAQVLSEAATAVSLAGGLAVAREIGQAFGLEEVRIETGEEAEESTLVVGKYLSPRVYVQYGVGLFQSINIFRFGYQLSRRFLLQGESGVDSGADLIYTIERK